MPLGALLPSWLVPAAGDVPYRRLVAAALLGGPTCFLLVMGWALRLQTDRWERRAERARHALSATTTTSPWRSSEVRPSDAHADAHPGCSNPEAARSRVQGTHR